MHKLIIIVAIAGLSIACGNENEESPDTDTDTSVNSITPPPTKDSTNIVAPMMGDSSKTEADSLQQ